VRSSAALDALTTLNLGSGRAWSEAAVNLDITSDTSPDVVHDLRLVPWPFPDDRFDRIEAVDVLEHLPDLIVAMEEIHRISRRGARIEIAVPHFSSHNSYTDPTHLHHLGIQSFDYFTGEHEHSYYTDVRFRMRARSIKFYRRPHDRLVARVAAHWPQFYERRLAWLFPAWFMVFTLEVNK
jgi:SAM-dependent methyltransferase